MSVVTGAIHSRSPIPSHRRLSSESRIQNNSKLNLTNKLLYGIFKLTNRKAFMYKEEIMIFEFDIVKNSRTDIAPYYHTQEVVGRESVELNIFGYRNPYEVFWKWASKAQRDYTKEHRTDARDSFIFREWSVGEEE